MAKLLLVVVMMLGVVRALDVVKTSQGWGEVPSLENAEALVVREGFVAPAFSLQASLLDRWLAAFTSPRDSFISGLYTEYDPQSRFLIFHHSPVAITGYGVVDGLGAISTTDPSLQVAASMRKYDGPESGFMYHLEMSYECAAEGTKRLVVVQLRTSPETANEEEELTFVFRKECPMPPPPPLALLQSWPLSSFTTLWTSGPGISVLVISSSGDGQAQQPSMILVLEEDPTVGEEEGSAPQQQQEGHTRPGGNPHHRHQHHPQQHQRPEEGREDGEQDVFSIPPWVHVAVMRFGLACLITTVIVICVDLVHELVRRTTGGDDSEAESVDGEEEAVPLLSGDDEEDEEGGTGQLERMKTPEATEEVMKPTIMKDESAMDEVQKEQPQLEERA